MRYLLCFALIPIVLAGCNRGPVRVKAEATVKTDVPKKKPLRRIIEQPATVEGFQEAPLIAHVSGYVKEVYVDIGADVEANSLLAELSVPELVQEHAQKTAMVVQARADWDQATEALKAAEARIATTEAQVREAKAAVGRADALRDRWASEYHRVGELYAAKVVEKQILDETLNQFRSAQATRSEMLAKVDSCEAIAKESVARRDKAKADVAAAKARIAVAQADEGKLKEMVGYREIRAPFKGIVTHRNIHKGHYLQPNAAGHPALVFSVARLDKLRIIADIPESEAMYIRDGLQAKIEAPIFKDETFAGEVSRTSKALDPKSRTLRVEVDYVNKEGKLRPGMFVNMTLTVALGERFTLPATAIFPYADAPCCWRVVDGKAVRTPLKTGVRDGADVEVTQMQTGPATWNAIDGTEEVVVANLGAVSEGKELQAKRQ
jgi:RND family efflux transporter MFP subunit